MDERQRRADKVNLQTLRGLDGDRRTGFLVGLKALGMSNPTDRAALRESVKRAFPGYSEKQVDVFVDGDVQPEADWMV